MIELLNSHFAKPVLVAKAKFIILNEIQHYSDHFFYSCYFDGQKISYIKKSEIKSIEFIQPNEL